MTLAIDDFANGSDKASVSPSLNRLNIFSCLGVSLIVGTMFLRLAGMAEVYLTFIRMSSCLIEWVDIDLVRVALRWYPPISPRGALWAPWCRGAAETRREL